MSFSRLFLIRGLCSSLSSIALVISALLIDVLVVPEHFSGLSVPKRHNNDLKGQGTLMLTFGFYD